MSKKLIELAQRRAALLRQIERQRTELAQSLAVWHRPLAVVDKGLQVARYLGGHPAVLAAGFALAASVRPKGALGWLQRGWLLWQTAVAVKRRLLP